MVAESESDNETEDRDSNDFYTHSTMVLKSARLVHSVCPTATALTQLSLAIPAFAISTNPLFMRLLT